MTELGRRRAGNKVWERVDCFYSDSERGASRTRGGANGGLGRGESDNEADFYTYTPRTFRTDLYKVHHIAEQEA